MKRGKGAQEACVKSTRRETDETKEDVEGRGREREEGRNVDGVGSVTAGARLGRAAEVAARRSADDDLRVSSDERVRRVAVLTVRRGARRQRECY